MRHAILITLLLLSGEAARSRAGLQAQLRATEGEVAGVVVDAATGGPLPQVMVSLEPMPSGLVSSSGSNTLSAARVTETDAHGGYRFAGVTPGRYRLRVARIGYRSTTLDVNVRRPMDARVSVALELEPVQLEAVSVHESAQPPFRRVADRLDEPAAARTLFERDRQAQFVTADARALTYADVVESVTLGETDVFRALQRFPGVATRDDYTAELWTRGAPWAQTRVTFDGQPLFNPVHGVGVFSAVPPEILGAVFFQPGYRSVSMGEGAAGVVDLRTRGGGGHGELRGAADVSMASARLELDQRPADRVGWIVSARRSYFNVLKGGLDFLGVPQLDLPYEFHDLSARVDVQLDARRSLETSALLEDDRLFGDVQGILASTHAEWGNAVARMTLHSLIASLQATHTLGISRYRSSVQEAGDSTPDGRPGPWVEPAADNRVVSIRWSTTLEPSSSPGRSPAWSAGLEVVSQSLHYDGPEPRFYPVRPDTTVRVLRADAGWNAGAWFELRRQYARLTLVPGLRLEGGSAIASFNGAAGLAGVPRTGGVQQGSLRAAPRLAARLALTPLLSLSASAARSWQYLQAIALAGPSAHPLFHASQFWLLAGDAAPAIRANAVTLGAEQWLGSGWLASATAYARHAVGVALPDPRPGSTEGRPLFVTGENQASGLELGLRRVAGGWTAALGCTLGRSAMEAAGLRFPASTDRARRLDATASFRIGRALQLGGAYSAMSGAPYTRVQTRLRNADCQEFGFGCSGPAGVVEAPNTRRTPAWQSLDLSATLTRAFGRTQASLYLQLRNVTGRDNAVTYSHSYYTPVRRPDGTGEEILWQDQFERGLPRLPLVGARVTF